MIQKPVRRIDSSWFFSFIVGGLSVFLVIWGLRNNQISIIVLGGTIFVLGFFVELYRYRLFKKEMKIYEDKIKQKQLEELRLYKLKLHDIRLFERGMRDKGLVKITRHKKEYWVTPEQEREWKFLDVDLENNFQKLSPRDFENVIGDLFKKMNYDVRRTPISGDYGADVIVKKDGITIVVQCKKYEVNHKVGAPEVQRTLGSMHRYKASKALLVTTSDFTKQARTQALNAPIELWNSRKLREQFEIAYLIN